MKLNNFLESDVIKMDSQEINKFIKENVDKIYDEMVKVRRTIHENPELGDEEFEKEFLEK